MKAAKSKTPFKTIGIDQGFIDAGSFKVGDRITIAGVKADKSIPGGFHRDCEPGKESILVVEPCRLVVLKE